MKHRFFSLLNMLLGSLSLLLAGCGSTQKTSKSIASEHQVMALYGEPVERFEPLPANEADTIGGSPSEVTEAPVPEVEQDTAIQRTPQIMVKYGVPFPRN